MKEPDAKRALENHAPATRVPAKTLACVCLLHAVPLAWAAFTLPWQKASWFALITGALAVLHLAVAVAAVSQRRRALAIGWQVLAVGSLSVLLVVTCVVVGSALYLSELYRGIGQAIAAALFGVWGLFVLFTVPISAWGLASTPWPSWIHRARARRVAAAVVAVATVATLLAARSARAKSVERSQPETVETLFGAAVRKHSAATSVASKRAHMSLFHDAPLRCAEPVDTTRLTVLVAYVDPQGTSAGVCIQASDSTRIAAELERVLEQHVAPGQPFKLDVVRAVHRLWRTHALIDALKIRPGVDGVCSGGKCFAPWQLVTLDAFTQYHPLDAVRDASFGCSFDDLARRLGVDAQNSQLTRIETESVLVRDGAFVPLRRLRAKRVDAGLETIERSTREAERHIVAAQEATGEFRYLLDPFRSDTQAAASVNLPRQAGTTLVLCELGRRGRPTRTAVKNALAQLATYERTRGELSALSTSSVRAQLGHSALPLIAFVSCRGWSGEVHDALIGRLARLLLVMQRPDGSFAPEFGLRTGDVRGEHEPLYATGQAVLALVLVDQLAAERPDGPWPPVAALASAIERAMDHYAGAYWPSALRSLFFLEENWHCLAARAALARRRHDGYERFCLDYVAFKSRLILDESDGVDEEHVGGYSLSNMLPPHSTPTAGFGEALAAAMAVKRARKLDLTQDRALMQRVLGFLVRQQWTRETCFACSNDAPAVGGFSESSASPLIRIDFVQHAMAALGHGLAMLEAEGS